MKVFKFTFLLWLLSAQALWAQMHHFTLFPHRVSTIGTVSASTLPGFSAGSPPSYGVGNGAYRENGSDIPYFTIRDREVFDGAGTKIGELPLHTQEPYCQPSYPSCKRTFNVLNPEISIVPIPGSCRRFYVLYSLYEPIGTVVLYSIVNADDPDDVYLESSTSNFVFPSNPYTSVSQTGNIAVSRKKTNGNYDMYVLWYDHIKRFELTSTGIVHITDLSVSGASVGLIAHEFELSPDGAYLAWGYNIEVYRKSTTTSGTPNVDAYPVSSVYGIEFHPTNSDIVYVSDGTNSIKEINMASSTLLSSIVLPTNWKVRSQLERDTQHRIYGIYVNGTTKRLFYFDQSNPGLPAVDTGIEPYSFDAYHSGLHYVYSLNKKLDGEDYSNFQGTPPIVFSTSINSLANDEGNWNRFYNCLPIDLALLTTAAEARISIVKTDALKNPLAGLGAFGYTSGWLLPAALSGDLRSLAGTANHLLNHHGYYELTIEVRNNCGAVSSAVWYLQVDAPPTSASIQLELNDYVTPGIPDSPVKTVPGVSMSAFSASFNINNSSGDITYYNIGIEQVSGVDGTLIRPIFQSPNIPVANVNTLIALALNSLTIPAIPDIGWAGGPAFFVYNGLGNTYKLTVEVGNDCGSSSDWSYMQINCMCRKGVRDLNDVADEDNVEVFPNPFGNELLVQGAGAAAKVRLLNAMGQCLYENNFIQLGNNLEPITIDAGHLPKGIYIYHVETDERVYTGKLLKE
jgi:hypothetical protein